MVLNLLIIILFNPIFLNHACAFHSSLGSLWLGILEEDLQAGTQHLRTIMSHTRTPNQTYLTKSVKNLKIFDILYA